VPNQLTCTELANLATDSIAEAVKAEAAANFGEALSHLQEARSTLDMASRISTAGERMAHVTNAIHEVDVRIEALTTFVRSTCARCTQFGMASPPPRMESPSPRSAGHIDRHHLKEELVQAGDAEAEESHSRAGASFPRSREGSLPRSGRGLSESELGHSSFASISMRSPSVDLSATQRRQRMEQVNRARKELERAASALDEEHSSQQEEDLINAAHQFGLTLRNKEDHNAAITHLRRAHEIMSCMDISPGQEGAPTRGAAFLRAVEVLSA